MKNKTILRLVVLVWAGLMIQAAVFGAQTQIQGKGKDKPKNINNLIHLKPPAGSESGAHGIAKISAKIKGAKPSQTFQVVGSNLKPGTYDLFVDGVKIASKAATADRSEDGDKDGAAVQFLFSTKANGPSDQDDEDGQRPLPASLQPVTEIKKVELKDSTGTVVLTGEF